MKLPKPKSSPSHFWQHRSKMRWALGGVLALVLIGQLAFNGFVLHWLYTRSSVDTRIADMIVEANDNLTKPAVIEPVRKQVYLPEASLVLPFLPEGVTTVRYQYNAASADYPAHVYITSEEALDQARQKLMNAAAAVNASPRNKDAIMMQGIFDEVPVLQACNRGYEIQIDGFTQGEDGLERVAELTLADGRTATVLRNRNCPFQPESMRDYLKQLKSYRPDAA